MQLVYGGIELGSMAGKVRGRWLTHEDDGPSIASGDVREGGGVGCAVLCCSRYSHKLEDEGDAEVEGIRVLGSCSIFATRWEMDRTMGKWTF